MHRPRNVGWARASALLYGDWGTSKAYVIGLAFVAAGFASFPIILAVCFLTGLVGYNYIIICKHFPDGGGVYSSAREQSRVLAVLGALLLLADFIVTAAMSCWDAMSYFGFSREHVRVATIGFILLLNPLEVCARLKRMRSKAVSDEWWSAFLKRANEIGAVIPSEAGEGRKP